MKLDFNIDWSGARLAKSATPADATRGTLEVRLGSEVVWPAFEWTWIDFLEHLARVWPALRWQAYPLELSPPSPADFPSLADQKLLRLSGDAADAAETEIWAFTEAHELSHALGGISLPPLWLVPEGNVVSIAAAGIKARLPVQDSLTALELLADKIAGRLAVLNDARAREALAAWKGRDQRDLAECISLYTGLALDWLRAFAPKKLEATFGLSRSFAPNEVLAVARATRGQLDPEDLKALNASITSAERRKTPDLDALTTRAMQLELPGKPWEQGYELAQWLRSELKVQVKSALSAEWLLDEWDVPVRDVELDSRAVDAVGSWGPKHGPVIVVNTNGAHAHAGGGRAATLAHEICHLLIDRRAAMPLAEAANGRVPDDLEARARAFAAELLAPKEGVRAVWQEAPGDSERRFKRVTVRFKVSRQLAAWQLLNSGSRWSRKDEAFLRQHADRV